MRTVPQLVELALTDPEAFVLEFVYTDGRGKRTKRIVSPYQWRETSEGGRESVLAFCFGRESVRQFYLHRMRDVRLIASADVMAPTAVEEVKFDDPKESAPIPGEITGSQHFAAVADKIKAQEENELLRIRVKALTEEVKNLREIDDECDELRQQFQTAKDSLSTALDDLAKEQTIRKQAQRDAEAARFGQEDIARQRDSWKADWENATAALSKSADELQEARAEATAWKQNAEKLVAATKSDLGGFQKRAITLENALEGIGNVLDTVPIVEQNDEDWIDNEVRRVCVLAQDYRNLLQHANELTKILNTVRAQREPSTLIVQTLEGVRDTFNRVDENIIARFPVAPPRADDEDIQNMADVIAGNVVEVMGKPDNEELLGDVVAAAVREKFNAGPAREKWPDERVELAEDSKPVVLDEKGVDLTASVVQEPQRMRFSEFLKQKSEGRGDFSGVHVIADELWPDETADGDGTAQVQKCPHGENPAECEACFQASDHAYDAAREDAAFGVRR